MSSINAQESKPHTTPRPMSGLELVVLWGGLVLWIAVFLSGTLVASAPFRERFGSFSGTPLSILRDALVVAFTYTLTNLGCLCLLASALGALGARVGLGTDAEAAKAQDTSAPVSSAVLRGFYVYMSILAGVLMFAETPTEPSQTQYVRLAGLSSLIAFTLNYHPHLFGNVLERAGALIKGSSDKGGQGGQGGAATE